jgi:ribosomal protein S12 methylthiotransferase accessory factor
LALLLSPARGENQGLILEDIMAIRISFPGGKRVDADLGTRVVKADQSVEHGGGGTAPEPFELFLASLATCAGIYVLGFCQARDIPTAGVEIVQRHHFDETTHHLDGVELEIVLPPTFPEKYRSAVERAAAGCKVKRVLASPPQMVVTTKMGDAAGAQAESA